ncbi:MAG: RimK/LysX family protein [Pseudomonadota bacterium]
MDLPKLRKKLKKQQEIGWCECIDLPGLGLRRIKAKIDSGAATSSIHATRIRPLDIDGVPHVEFWFRAHKGERAARYRAPVVEQRSVTSSNGERQLRYVIETTMRLGKLHWRGHLTLANRGRMTFPILIGRRALRRGFLVNCRHRYMLGKPEESDR